MLTVFSSLSFTICPCTMTVDYGSTAFALSMTLSEVIFRFCFFYFSRFQSVFVFAIVSPFCVFFFLHLNFSVTHTHTHTHTTSLHTSYVTLSFIIRNTLISYQPFSPLSNRKIVANERVSPTPPFKMKESPSNLCSPVLNS